MNTLAHYGGMFDYFKGTCASYTLPTHLNVKSDGCLGRFQHFSCGLLMFLLSKSNISVQKDWISDRLINHMANVQYVIYWDKICHLCMLL